MIGPERSPQMGWLCGYAPEGIHCDREAAWHAVTVNENPELQYSFAACEEHVQAVRPLSLYVHPHDAPCGIPGALFLIEENRCVVDWESGDLEAVAASEMTVS